MIDPQGKQIRMENNEFFQAEVRKQRENLRCRCSCRPGCFRSLFCSLRNDDCEASYLAYS